MALQFLSNKVMAMAAGAYQRSLTNNLRKVGLRIEDLLNEDEADIKEALALSDPEVRTGRTRRLKRAFDLGVKQKNFLDYAADVDQETFKSEIYDLARQIRVRDHEFAMLNQHKK